MTTKKKSPAADGEPLMPSSFDIGMPNGNDPELKEHVYGATPPTAVIICVGYCCPVIPFGSAVVVTTAPSAQSTAGNDARKSRAHRTPGTGRNACLIRK